MFWEFAKWFKEFEIDWFTFREPSVKKTMEIYDNHKQMLKDNKTELEYYIMFLTNLLYWKTKEELLVELEKMTPNELALFFLHILKELWLEVKNPAVGGTIQKE